MAFDVSTLLIPPTGSGDLDPRWWDWLPTPGTGQTQKDAVLELLDGYCAGGEAALTAADVEITDPAVMAYVLWKAYASLCIEYGRRVGATSIANEVSVATGSATAKPFCDAAAQWKLEWQVFVPASGIGSGSGVSASVPSRFTF